MAELLARFGLSEAADRLARTYPDGMQRRLDIAMGVVHRAQELFLDESTTGLDPEVRAAMWDEISRLALQDGLTIGGPCWPANTACIAYSGLVPMSPNTTPSAPTTNAAVPAAADVFTLRARLDDLTDAGRAPIADALRPFYLKYLSREGR